MKKWLFSFQEKVDMKSNKKLVNNTKQVFKLLIISPIVWFGTFGENQICLNFTVFFSIFVGIILTAFIIAKDKIKEDMNKSELSNDFLNALVYLIPASLLIADGWIITGLIWFLCWAMSNSTRSEIKKEDNS
jgi:hypothetical protein